MRIRIFIASFILLYVICMLACSKSGGNQAKAGTTGSINTDTSTAAIDTTYMVDTYAGTVANDSVNGPTELCVDSKGFLYVAETNHSVVLKVDPLVHLVGPFTGAFDQPGCLDDPSASGDPSLTFPSNLWISDDDIIYIGDYGCGDAKACTTTASSQKIVYNDPNFLSPAVNGATVDYQQNIYLYDTYGGLYKIKPSDHIITPVGTSTQFGIISSMTMDAADKNVILSAGHKIWQVTPDGNITVIAGSDTVGNADGAGIKAQFGGAMVICVDPSNNIYVADMNNNTIRMVTPAGTVSTIAGSGLQGYKDGGGKNAVFNGPSGIAFTTSGNNNILYVSDYYNNVIRRITFKKQ